MIYEIDCEFNDPIDLNGPGETPDFEYSKMSCQATSTDPTLALIKNTETGSEFYLSKTLNYGDLFLIFFLTIFLVFGIWKFFWDLMIPKLVKVFNRSE